MGNSLSSYPFLFAFSFVFFSIFDVTQVESSIFNSFPSCATLIGESTSNASYETFETNVRYRKRYSVSIKNTSRFYSALDELFSSTNQVFQFNAVLYLDQKSNVTTRTYFHPQTPGFARFNADSIFKIASLTKQFVSVALLYLQQNGKIKLDDSICKYLEFCPEDKQQITIYHLLTHTSGFSRSLYEYNEYAASMQKEGYTPIYATRDDILRQRIKLLLSLPLQQNPGEKFLYSNIGYSLLAYIIERVTGREYGDFLREEIWMPISMTWTGSLSSPQQLPSDLSERLGSHGVILNEHRAKESWKRGNQYRNYPLSSNTTAYIGRGILESYGAGDIFSNASNLAMWNQALFEHAVIIDQKSVQAMVTPYLENYGLGILVKKTSKSNEEVYIHNGYVSNNSYGDGSFSLNAYYPNLQLSVIVLSPHQFWKGSGERFRNSLLKLLFEKPYEIPVLNPLPVEK